MGNQVCGGMIKAKKKDESPSGDNTPTKANTVAPDTQHTIDGTRQELNMSPDQLRKVKGNQKESAILEESKNESKPDEEERKM